MDAALITLVLVIGTFFGRGVIGFTLGYAKGSKSSIKLTHDHPPSPISWILCFIGSGVCLLIAICALIYSVYFLAKSEPTEGKVTDIVEHTDSEGETSRSTVYSYTTPQGDAYTDRTSTSDGREF